MLPTFHNENNNSGKSYIDSNYLNNVTPIFDKIGIQDPIVEIV
jgi:hypothetical protein